MTDLQIHECFPRPIQPAGNYILKSPVWLDLYNNIREIVISTMTNLGETPP